MKNKTLTYFVSSFVLMLMLAVFFNKVDYIGEEGFNPSDDGVLLAQSYRILNGEIPHKDFISIRPAFSGLIHSIHFFSPMPLQTSARWFVLFENFAAAFFWSLLLFRLIKTSNRIKNILLFQSVLLLIFIINLNNYTIYPWTTIDALLFVSAGFYFWSRIFDEKKSLIPIFTGLFLLSVSALCRQNFVFLIVLAIPVTCILLRRNSLLSRISLGCVISLLPFVLYLGMVAYHSAMQDFVRQMTGRTELFQTGILKFGKQFFTTPFLIWYAFLILGVFISKFNNFLFKKFKDFLWIISIVNLLIICLLSIVIFMRGPEFLFGAAFELFWLLGVSLFIGFYYSLFSSKEIYYGIIVLVSAWVCSISLGDNTPIFVTGTLGVFAAYYNIKIVSIKYNLRKTLYFIMIAVFSVFIMIFSIQSQKNFNYRDLPSRYLNHNLGELFEEFGNTKTSKNTWDYYRELRMILNSNPGMKDSFILLPNNAIIYPITGSRNPFPLDWMQHDEYIGSEEIVNAKVEKLLKSQKVWILLDKFDSKKIAYELVKMEYDSVRYGYYGIIEKNTKKVDDNFIFFELRKN